MSASEEGPGPEDARTEGARGSLETLPLPTRPDGRVGRSLQRLRVLRLVLVLFALGLGGIVAWSILSRRPNHAPVIPARTSPAGPDDALQTIEKFKFTSTLSGKPAYSIIADRLKGIAGGIHSVEGIRSIQIMRPDGTVLTGSADRGSFVEADSARGSVPTGGTIVLEGHVHIEGSTGERFDSERVEYFQRLGKIVSPGPATFSLPATKSEGPASVRTLSGSAARLEYEMTTHALSLEGGVDLTLEEPGVPSTRVRSESARADADSGKADFEGGVSVLRDRDTLAAPSVHVERFPAGGLRLVAGPGARARILNAVSIVPSSPAPGGSADSDRGTAGPGEPGRSSSRTATADPHTRRESVDPGRARAAASPGVPSPPPGPSPPVLVSADRLEITETPGSHERVVHLTGAARVEEESVPGILQGRTIEAAEILLQDPGGAEGRRLHATGNVLVLLPPGPGEPEPRRLTCQTLDALSTSGGKLSKAEAAGGVTLRAGHRVATAERATVLDETHAELRGSRPKLEEQERTLVANEIDLLSDPRRAEGRGNVHARFVPREGSATGPFEPGELVEIVSERAALTEQPSRGDFQGKVIARQGERALTAARVFVDDAQKTMTAEGGVSLRTFREETTRAGTPPKTGPSGPSRASGAAGDSRMADREGSRAHEPPSSHGPAAVATAGSATARVPVQVDGDSLFYDSARKAARFEGHALYREPGRRLSADRITMSGSTAGQGDGGRPSEVIAEGHVILEGEGKRGAADFARYRSDQRAVTLEGRERQAELIDVATGRTWRGPALTWLLTPDSIPVVTGDSGRSRIVGSATGPGQDRVGKNADRRRSR